MDPVDHTQTGILTVALVHMQAALCIVPQAEKLPVQTGNAFLCTSIRLGSCVCVYFFSCVFVWRLATDVFCCFPEVISGMCDFP